MMLPFSIKAETSEKFNVILKRAIKIIAESDKSILKTDFDISTGSADIPLELIDFKLTVEEIVKKFGWTFTVRTGTIFKIDC